MRVFAPDEGGHQGRARSAYAGCVAGCAPPTKLDKALSCLTGLSYDEIQKLAERDPWLDIRCGRPWWCPRVIESFTVRGRDYEYPGTVKGLGNLNAVFTGVGPFRHNDPRDRPAAVFGGNVTLHMGPDRQACVLLPIIPPK